MIVLDSSAAVAMVRSTAEGQALSTLILQDELVISSEMFIPEVRSAFWKYVRANLMTVEEATFYIDHATKLIDRFIPLRENADESFVEAVRQNHSIYDMFYLTLVRRTAGTLFSLDKQLINLCKGMGLNAVTEIRV